MNIRDLIREIFDTGTVEVQANWISGYVDAKIAGATEAELARDFPESIEGFNDPEISELRDELELLLRAEQEGTLEEPPSLA